MADDLGYETLGINGSNYDTPVLDSLALNGINFTNAFSQPLCTPSRVKIMTGKPNYINYEYFTFLNPNEKTFGNLFKDNGYRTALVGKWQLNGVQFDLKNNQDLNRPYNFGFDEYCLWWLNERGSRFANPYIIENGKKLQLNIDDYGPDIYTNYIINFIDKNKENPFFIYYPMALVHDPFQPTPNSKDWVDQNKRQKGNKVIYFSEMVNYMDTVVGRIVNSLKKNNLDNTILIFIGDNGTDTRVVTLNNGKKIRGAKGSTIKYSSNVPLIINWKKELKNNFQSDVLIDLTDFYSTFEDILDKKIKQSFGKSLLPLILKKDYEERKILITYYNPMWGNSNPKIKRGVYAQTKKYKLYKNGKFYNYSNDLLERSPLKFNDLSKKQKDIYKNLLQSLETIPSLPKYNHNKWIEKKIIKKG
tara:strand:- start:2514 stop:3764 length:1251 start_codon:yes stop_codon:yes gene_type:complete